MVLQAVRARSWQLAHTADLLLAAEGPGAAILPACSAQKLACSSLCPTRTAGKAPTRISRVYATKMQEATGLFQIFYRTRSTYAGECWASRAGLAHCTHSIFGSHDCWQPLCWASCIALCMLWEHLLEALLTTQHRHHFWLLRPAPDAPACILKDGLWHAPVSD